MSLGSSLMSSFQAQPTACIDTPLWDNNSGRRCADYSREGWCRNGMLTLTWTGGAQFNHPERECCACGKGATAMYCALGFAVIHGINILMQMCTYRKKCCFFTTGIGCGLLPWSFIFVALFKTDLEKPSLVIDSRLDS